jgi:hypothetical protein
MVRTNKTSGAPRAEQYSVVTGTSLAQGHGTFHGPRMMSVARDDQAYRQWQGALGQTLPAVDFDTQQVVIVFAGNSPFGTTFNSISVTELRLLEDGDLGVKVSAVINQAGPSRTDSPYHYVVMDRTSGPVTFHVQTR